jgi:hypothetical protein
VRLLAMRAAQEFSVSIPMSFTSGLGFYRFPDYSAPQINDDQLFRPRKDHPTPPRARGANSDPSEGP